MHAAPKDLMRLANGNGPRYGHSPGTPVVDLLIERINKYGDCIFPIRLWQISDEVYSDLLSFCL